MYGASQVAQLSGIHMQRQETHVRSLGWEDPLGEEMATHPSILAWEIPWTEEPGELKDTTEQLTLSLHCSLILFLLLLLLLSHG